VPMSRERALGLWLRAVGGRVQMGCRQQAAASAPAASNAEAERHIARLRRRTCSVHAEREALELPPLSMSGQAGSSCRRPAREASITPAACEARIQRLGRLRAGLGDEGGAQVVVSEPYAA
jgi:hypothetical protein